MPETTAPSDAERPIGRFITEKVLPAWDEMNTFETVRRHSSAVASALLVSRVRTHRFPGLWSTYLYNGRVAGGQYGRLTTLVSAQALEACASKWLTLQYWRAAGIPVPYSLTYSADQLSDAQRFLQHNPHRSWVLRPDAARHGRGTVINVDDARLPSVWQHAAEVRPTPVDPHHALMLQEYHEALPLRVFVVGSRARAAAVRVPLFVIGDGTSTVRQLIQDSFTHRERHAMLRQTLPEITSELLRSGAPGLDQVPAAESLHILSDHGGLAQGGLPFDVTDMVSRGLLDLAVSAAEAIPGLGAAGIDILTPDLDSAEDAVVLDADAWASLLIHRNPAFGRRRPVAPAIAELIRLRAEHWERVTLPAAMAPSAGSGEDD